MKNIPNHIAIIVDGNVRWAPKRGLSKIDGHIEGEKIFRQVCVDAEALEVKTLTMFAFSTKAQRIIMV